jgi:hypothetical protein
MNWIKDLKSQLNIGGDKYILYVNCAPINSAIIASVRPVIVKSEACYKVNLDTKEQVLVVGDEGRYCWLTSHLSNGSYHVKGKHRIQFNTVFKIGGVLGESP